VLRQQSWRHRGSRQTSAVSLGPRPPPSHGPRSFRNAYRHGFAHIVAATVPVRIADPATKAATN